MTSANTNYGVQLSDSDGSIGEITSIDPPEYMNAEVEATNHASGGHREFISGGLQEMASFKATVNYVNADIADLVTKLQNGNKNVYTMTFPTGHKMTFAALVTSIKPLAADAKSPDVLSAEITFRPSDSLAMSS